MTCIQAIDHPDTEPPSHTGRERRLVDRHGRCPLPHVVAGAESGEVFHRVLRLGRKLIESSRGRLDRIEIDPRALQRKATRPADGGALVEVRVTVAQQQADLKRFMNPNVGEFGRGRSDEREVARCECSLEPGIGTAITRHEHMFACVSSEGLSARLAEAT
jgi:hypothetical protein